MEPRGSEFDISVRFYDEVYENAVKFTGFPASYFDEHKVKETHRVLCKRPGFPAAPSILDFGCGVGNASPYLRKYFPHAALYGVDISGESIRAATEKNQAHRVSYAVIDEDGSGPFPFGIQFDLVVVFNVLHHVDKNEHLRFFQRVKPLLKPGGLLVCHDMNPYNPVIKWAFHKYDMRFDPAANLLRPGYLRSQLIKAGFRPSRPQYEVFFPAFLSFLLPLEKHMTWLPFGARHYSIAVNPD